MRIPRGEASPAADHDGLARLPPHSTVLVEHDLRRRQFSSDAVENANIRTGVIVGVVLGLALLGAAVFFCWYRNSVRFTYGKRRRRRRKSGGSHRSKSSRSSDGGPPEPPPPPPEVLPDEPPPPPKEDE